MKHDKHYDVIIIGGSYAGLAAGLALGRALRDVLIIDSGDPCNRQTPYSHNFLTNDGKTPHEIAGAARQQVQQYDSVDFLNDWVAASHRTENDFEVHVQRGERFRAKKLVVATGIKDIMPEITGLSACWGISVLHCPYCHGYEVRHQKTGIIANGDNGFELSALISNWTNDLTLYTNGTSILTPQQRTKLEQHQVGIIETEIELIEHASGHIRNIVFKNGGSAPAKVLYARLPFAQHSDIPQMLGCELTPEGYVKIDSTQRTTVHGVFACGDNATRMRTVANAVSMGTTTGLMVNKELIEETF
jgi:thioredoxin reductase